MGKPSQEFEVIEYDAGKYSLGLVPHGRIDYSVVNEDGKKIFEGTREECVILLSELNGNGKDKRR